MHNSPFLYLKSSNLSRIHVDCPLNVSISWSLCVHYVRLHVNASQPWLHIGTTWGALKILIPVSHRRFYLIGLSCSLSIRIFKLLLLVLMCNQGSKLLMCHIFCWKMTSMFVFFAAHEQMLKFLKWSKLTRERLWKSSPYQQAMYFLVFLYIYSPSIPYN